MPGKPNSTHPFANKPLPEGIKEAVKLELAREPMKKSGAKKIETIAAKFGISPETVRRTSCNFAEEIEQMRQQIAKSCMEIAGSTLGRLASDVADDKIMAKTPFRDKAIALGKMVDAGLTAQDGHQQPMVQFNFQQLAMVGAEISDYDKKIEAKRRQLMG